MATRQQQRQCSTTEHAPTTAYSTNTGAQWEKASEVFEQMKYQGCRPDVVTYTALIGAYERGGQWRSVVKTFDAMQAQGCKPDSFVHQTLVDVLWCTGVVWAQARALALYNNAARNWPYRFCVQQVGHMQAAGQEWLCLVA